jgi:hypothetical protein
MKITKLPLWMNELLASCPKSGDGVHTWLFVAALKLHRHFKDKEELVRRLVEATAGCGRDVPDSEIRDAVRNSAPDRDGQPHAGPRWPARNAGRIESIVRDGPNFEQLEHSSPVKWNDDARRTEEIIDALFPGNPLLCAAPKQSSSVTRTREEWRGYLDRQQFIVPSPMSATHGITKSDTRSMRCLANTGPRRFLVVEFDQGTFDQHAAVLWHLANYAPMVMVVHSGNKSAHGWFYCANDPESAVEKFFRYAVSLGADHATWTRCQLVRMPDGQRDNGTRQRVVFFNPKPMEAK